MKKSVSYYLLLAIMCCLCSCNSSDDNFDGDQMTYLLCRAKWGSFFTDYTGAECEQVFLFEKNGNGTEIYTRFNPGKTEVNTYYCYWYWTSGYFDSICIEYGPNDKSYLDITELNYNYLRGYLDGVYVEFIPL